MIAIDVAEPILLDELSQREEVRIPASILKNREHSLALTRELRERPRFGRSDRHRLVDDHVLTRLERRAHLREVGLCRCRDNDGIEVLSGKQLDIARKHIRARQHLADFIAPTTDDCGNLESCSTKQRRMKVPPRQSKSDQTDSHTYARVCVRCNV